MAYDEAVFTVEEINALLANGIGGVKSIQKGVYTNFSTTADVTININAVNKDKAFVILNSNIAGMTTYLTSQSATYLKTYQSILKEMTNSSIKISPCYVQTGPSSYQFGVTAWQVIEFY